MRIVKSILKIYKISIVSIMDAIDNKIMPIEATIPVKKASPKKQNLTIRRKRCVRGSRRNKKTHRCRKNKSIKP